MSALKVVILSIISTVVLVACQEGDSSSEIVPKTTFVPTEDSGGAHPQIADMYKIVVALERYKLDNRSYPISSHQGDGWDGILSKYGESRKDWIKGLVPNYLRELPVDSRKPTSDEHQFIYKSNGANYKLIVHSSSDCELVRSLYPKVIDPKRDCYAYGFWTKRATKW